MMLNYYTVISPQMHHESISSHYLHSEAPKQIADLHNLDGCGLKPQMKSLSSHVG